MAENSKIEWTMHTANLWHGCTKVHAGCDNCYAETQSKRWKRDIWGNDRPRLIIRSVWEQLQKFQAAAEQAGEMHRVFVGSMMDIFEKPMPLVDGKGNKIQVTDTGFLRNLFFQQIDAGMYNNLMFLFLTKRPSNINKMIPEYWKYNPPKNVMFGTSPVDQQTFDHLVPQLYQVNGKRFLSIEPQLGPIDIKKELPTGKGQVAYGLLMDWIINGGESGSGRRPYNPDWGRQLKADCYNFGIPFFMKQIDKVIPVPEDLQTRNFYVENL